MKFNTAEKVAVAVFIIVIATSLFLFTFFRSPQYSDKVNLIVAVPALEQSTLLYIADSQGFFSGNNLNVTITNVDSGVSAINEVLKGRANIAESAEFPFVTALLKNESLSIIAANDRFENDYIVALRSHGIEHISDLKGKTVGLSKWTIAEFYFNRFLQLNNLNTQDVNVIDVNPSRFVEEFLTGDIDALVAWQPYIDQVQNIINEAITWPVQSDQTAYSTMICDKDLIIQNPQSVELFLKSLKQAEDYVIGHSDESKTVVEKKLNYTRDYVDGVWSQHSFMLSLDQGLVTAMQDETKWSIDNSFTNQTWVPKFSDYIYTSGLEVVKPQSITIIK